MRAISARICTRSFASRFDSGSSIRNACGWRTIARPIATRWRWPPDSAAGLRFNSSSRPRIRAASCTRVVDLVLRHLLQLEPERHVVEHGHVRIQRVVLEHHGDVALLRRHVVDDAVADAHCSLRRSTSRPATIRSAVVLPQPDGPTRTTNSLSAIVEVEALGPRRCRRDRPSRRRRARSLPRIPHFVGRLPHVHPDDQGQATARLRPLVPLPRAAARARGGSSSRGSPLTPGTRPRSPTRSRAGPTSAKPRRCGSAR